MTTTPMATTTTPTTSGTNWSRIHRHHTTAGALTSLHQDHRATTSSLDCLTRQEESLLKVAAAMVIVKGRFRKRQDQQRRMQQLQRQKEANKKNRPRGMDKALPEEALPPTRRQGGGGGRRRRRRKRRNLLLDSIFKTKTISGMAQGLGKLLEKPHRDHLDQLFPVACRLAASIVRVTGVEEEAAAAAAATAAATTTTPAASVESSQRTLNSLACHFVHQLDSWTLQLTSKQSCTTIKSDTLSSSLPTSPSHGSRGSSPSQLKVLEQWLTTSLLSHSKAAWVHRVMVLQAFPCHQPLTTDRRILLDCWWHVTAILLSQVYHGIPLVNHYDSYDALAVALLGLLETLALVSSSSYILLNQPILPPDCLQELLVPLVAPTNLSHLQWTLASTMNNAVITAQGSTNGISGNSNIDSQQEVSSYGGGLQTGAKLLLRLGLYRILLLPSQPARPNDSLPMFLDGDDGHDEETFYYE